MDALHGPRYRIHKTLLSRPPARGAGWAALLSVLVLAFVQLIYQQDLFGIGDLLSATRDQVFKQHEYWRAWSTIMVHADAEHFLNNFGFFAGLAFLLRGYFGKLAFPVLSLLFGGVVNLISLATYQGGETLVGASGVIYFMAAFWLALYVGTDRSMILSRRLAGAMAFGLVLLFPQNFEPRVSYRTHFIGLILGLLVGTLYFLLRKREIRRAEVRVAVEPDELSGFCEDDSRCVI